MAGGPEGGRTPWEESGSTVHLSKHCMATRRPRRKLFVAKRVVGWDPCDGRNGDGGAAVCLQCDDDSAIPRSVATVISSICECLSHDCVGTAFELIASNSGQVVFTLDDQVVKPTVQEVDDSGYVAFALNDLNGSNHTISIRPTLQCANANNFAKPWVMRRISCV